MQPSLHSQSGISTGTLGAVIVGAGPAGLGPLIAARGQGTLAALVDDGLAILHHSSQIGPGELGRYAIRSDSFADSFLAPAALAGQPSLAPLLQHGAGQQLEQQRGGPVPLSTVAEFMADIGQHLRTWLDQHDYDPFICGATALHAHRQSDGTWLTSYRNAEGGTSAVRSRHVVLATGAAQSRAALEHATVAGQPLLPRFGDKTVLSGDLLAHGGKALLAQRLHGKREPRVVVVGGSHSAMSSALVCLQHWDAEQRQQGRVTILHRRPFRITYASPEVARAEGYHDFTPDDICPRSGRVFPLAGMRSDSRHLLRRYLSLGDAMPEPRLQMLSLDQNQQQAAALLEEADLIVAALGYRPRALPLYERDGHRIALQSERAGAALVDDRSRVLDAGGQPVRGVYALGLSAGYPMAGVHGEPSFRGEANGLSLWHGAIGADIVNQILAHQLHREDERIKV